MLLEALEGTQSLPAPDPDFKGVAANDAIAPFARVEILYHLSYVCVGDDEVPALACLVESSGLKSFHDFIRRHAKASHQLRDRGKSSRYVVAVGDLPYPFFR